MDKDDVECHRARKMALHAEQRKSNKLKKTFQRNLTSHLFSDLHSKRHLSKGEESFVFLRLKA